ncbi:NAD-dependent malic enzyme [Candidatus Kaiserbacteria bacterium CG10_big_fil_rev_8_21_14_0_10_45_20]|uniref:NAD-dependent malic enzyme n=1 Tax=Candidatus Kaiserbacteria bacterium CG10_big_fil_rev_8_21_14_0_10_45_20 TaxID=1974607 RepID=A0A2H0UFL3_9BACT|nr:MAG: NAD-dependent malic enzyme [Candidatus Kaiserbacteria bacterium CG10_big_fil_rev_8_21_14_0_10_45_20]
MTRKKKYIGAHSLSEHKKLKGKIEVVGKVHLKTLEDWSTFYTPGVGAVSTHLGKTPEDARVYTIKRNTVAVVSDGSAVLGLGNIGPYGALPVMEGKALIFKDRANIDAFPIVLDTQDPDEIIETVVRIAPAFGGINLEDIAAPQCFYIEEELKKRLPIPVMHDDQHGTAIVVLAGLINALTVVKKKLSAVSITVVGAGAAGFAIAQLLKKAGASDIRVTDRVGVIGKHRAGLAPHKTVLANLPTKRPRAVTLLDATTDSDVLIAVSGPGTVTAEHIIAMNSNAIVFALANPTPEIMPNIATQAGATVVATGRSDFPNQINNALVFPGIFRGALDSGVSDITEDMKLKAAYALARLVKAPHKDNIVPSVLDGKVAKAVARAVSGFKK